MTWQPHIVASPPWLGGEAGRRPDEGVGLRETVDIERQVHWKASASDPKDLPSMVPYGERLIFDAEPAVNGGPKTGSSCV
jgi:hypothetical protein